MIMSVTALVMLLVSSGCKKQGKSQAEQIVGLWNFNFSGIDSNGNGALDIGERQLAPTAANPDLSYELHADGNGRRITTIPEAIQWQLSSQNDYLRITHTTGDTDTMHIYSLTDDELIFSNMSAGTWHYGGFKKQY